ncbi:leucine-rich repeat flightless-interacting protein 2 isoform X16 [Amblyraja radiata]|uniref:leucine-rich repeat flightless-interacting protein 2 isoform X16 n=1 Tax=Amblyraja radiata TaxID=386614 RepID=UPI001402850D|nr:leucine-rich repeat flightless-interacting protein 2 isoform X16 [Amblyraja radiata]
MGTPGAGRKRTPIKDRFSAEDEALSHIAREAEARLAAKRAARAEARDIRMKELERQQKELYRSSNRKWGEIHQWMENTERAKHSFRPHQHYLTADDAFSVRSASSQRHPSLDVGVSYRSSSRQKDLGSLSRDKDKSAQLKKTSRSSSVYSNAQAARKKLSTSSNDILSGIYHDKRKYSTLSSSKSFSSSYTRPSSLYSAPIITTKSYRASYDTGLTRSQSLASLNDEGLHSRDWRYNSRTLDEKTESFSRPASRNAVSGLSAATLASLGGPSSRRGSGDMSSILDPDVSLSEMRDSLSEVEEKYKKAMVSNAQLDNDKSNLIYQVDTLKDVIEEMEEQMAELYRENEDKSKELERQKHMYHVSQHKVEELKEGIRQRDELIEENKCMQQRVDTLTREVFDLQETVNWKDRKIGALERQKDYFDCIRNERDELRDELADLRERKKNHGLVIIPESTPNGDLNHDPVVGAITVVSQEAAHVLEGAGDGPLDVRLKKLADEKEELLTQIRKLKLQLEEERQKSSKVENVLTDSDRLENGTDLQILEMQRDANRQLSEYKFKLSKAEQDFATVEQNVARLEGQLHRYKSATENSEKVEDELKAEKRRLQRELRLALDKNEEMEMTNSHLVKRLEKMKANRNALLSQQ